MAGPAWMAVAVSGVALAGYLLTLAPDLTWANAAADGGELITASATLGIPHPPGYPTYVLAGKLFSLIPIAGVAFRYNLFSAVCASAAAGLLALAIYAHHHPRIGLMACAAPALLFAFTPLVWSQAVVAEVYTLNLVVLAAFLLVWSRSRASGWSGLWLGVALTTHLTSLFMLPALWFGGGNRARGLAGLVIGLTPLLLLPVLARGSSPVVWGNPVDPAGWLWVISGQLYKSNLNGQIGVDRILALLRAVAFGPALVSFADIMRKGRTGRTVMGRSLASLRDNPAILLAVSVLLYFGFPIIYTTPDSAVLVLPGLMVVAFLVAPLFGRLGSLSLLLPAMLAIVAFGGQDLSGETPVRPLAEEVLNAAPSGSILLTPGDRTIFTLWYFHHVEGLRPDLRLIDTNLYAFDWYRARLSRLYPDVAVPAGDDLPAFQQENSPARPICLVGLLSAPEAFPNGMNIAFTQDSPPFIVCIEEND